MDFRAGLIHLEAHLTKAGKRGSGEAARSTASPSNERSPAWLVSAGVPLAEVRDLLGHSTIRMTERYAHLAPENVRAAVARLEGQDTPPTPPEEGPESRSSHVKLTVMPGGKG